MAEKPILFSGPMVRAILNGRKSQTRRVIQPQPRVVHAWNGECLLTNQIFRSGRCGLICPYGINGDTLWVRETWATYGMEAEPVQKRPIFFRADDDTKPGWATPPDITWRPSIHMPRWASRITLKVTGVRVERLQEISEADSKAEGIEKIKRPHFGDYWWKNYGDPIYLNDLPNAPELHWFSPRDSFKTLWNSINAKRGFGWDVNPWVWVVESERANP